MDIIYLHQLKVECAIGVWAWEKQIKQALTIDLDIAYDFARAAAADDLEQTLSYKDVAKRVQAFVAESRFGLVEKLAEAIAEILLNEFHAPWCRVRIDKFGAIRGAGSVGVIIERGTPPASPAKKRAKKKT